MKSFIHHLFRDKSVATMLLISSFIIGICALAPSLFVLIVLDKYLASGITSTLISLSIGAIILLSFEFAFRQNRASMIQALNRKIFQPIIDALSKKIKDTQHLGYIQIVVRRCIDLIRRYIIMFLISLSIYMF